MTSSTARLSTPGVLALTEWEGAHQAPITGDLMTVSVGLTEARAAPVAVNSRRRAQRRSRPATQTTRTHCERLEPDGRVTRGRPPCPPTPLCH